MDKGQVKQRKKSNKKDKGKPKASSQDEKKDTTPSTNEEKEDTRTLSQVFFEHPLVVVAPWILGPYLLYMAYFYVLLQRPDLLAPLEIYGIQLRPAVAINDPAKC